MARMLFSAVVTALYAFVLNNAFAATTATVNAEATVKAVATGNDNSSGAVINQSFASGEKLPIATPGLVVPQGGVPTNLSVSAQSAELIAAMAFVEACRPTYTRETRMERERSNDSKVFFTPHQHYLEVKRRNPKLLLQEVVPGFTRKSGNYICLGQMTVKHRTGETDVAFQSLPDSASAYLLEKLSGTKRVHIISHFDLVSLYSTMQGESQAVGGGTSVAGAFFKSAASAALQVLGIGGSYSNGSSASRTEFGITYFVLAEADATDPLARQIGIGSALEELKNPALVQPPISAAEKATVLKE